ncbi:peptide deformylase [Eubacteriales bacterium OttesenSCG-928-G02]|nr:peptide deformylase [Eubacteriales bacterium OttesenSCG-928-G02]
MAELKILLEGEETLRKKSRRVDVINTRILTLLDDMRETLIISNGVGLAAPQVGVLKRIFLVDTGEEIVEFINPEIIATEGEIEDMEACLSLPGKCGIVVRPEKVTVKALNRNNEEFTITGEEIIARAFCHENDHLDGILYIDKAIEMVDPDDSDRGE